jgi:hypothetical protein
MVSNSFLWLEIIALGQDGSVDYDLTTDLEGLHLNPERYTDNYCGPNQISQPSYSYFIG